MQEIAPKEPNIDVAKPLLHKKWLWISLAIVVILAVLSTWIGLHAYRFLVRNAVTTTGESQRFYIEKKISSSELISRLDTALNISSVRMMRTHARLMDVDSIRPGCFTIPNVVSDRELLNMFRANMQTPVRLTFRYAKTLPALAGKMSSRLLADSASIASALCDSALAAHYGFEPHTAIAMYLPDTYEVLWTITPAQLVERMAKEYERYWNSSRRAAAAEQGLTPLEVSVLASIVCSETHHQPEMATVAGLYLNRLRKGILLQSDPTVLFALNQQGIRRVLNNHLQVESPYNTYKYKGLPPGPICMPQKEAIEAVLHPEQHNYIFMCAKETFDGTHNFAATLSQHTANARKYHAALNARGIK